MNDKNELLCLWCGEQILATDDKDPHEEGFLHSECTEAMNDTPMIYLEEIECYSQPRPLLTVIVAE